MKTNNRYGRQFGWSARIGIAAIALAFAATGFAAPIKGSVVKKYRAGAKVAQTKCYVVLTSSPFPQPCERLGSVPSTASPMDIVGEYPPMQRARQ